MAFANVRTSIEGVAFLAVSVSEGDMDYIHVSECIGGLAFVNVHHSEGSMGPVR